MVSCACQSIKQAVEQTDMSYSFCTVTLLQLVRRSAEEHTCTESAPVLLLSAVVSGSLVW